jgi:sugar/nucleoside kinase (ribokinase family)
VTGPRILVVGDLVTDVVVRPVGALAHGSDTPAAIRVTGGGAGANTAAWLASAGAAVSLVARIGDDSAGRERRAELVALGVDCAAVAVDPDAPTGTIVVLVTADGERTMLPDRGANRRLRPADVDAGLAAAPTHLHLSGYVLLDDATRPAGLHALAAARSAGLTVSVDAASAAPLAATGPAAFLGWIDGIDLLLANADEATVLTGVTDAAAAAGKLVGTAGIVVVKRGADGSVWCSAGTRASAGATATELVDSTGAGDAFAAGLLAAWLEGAEPAVALRAGGASGARAASVLGARP